MDRSWMNADETAACLQITKATLYKLVHERRVPAERHLGRWMFRPEDIENLFEPAAASTHAMSPDGPRE